VCSATFDLADLYADTLTCFFSKQYSSYNWSYFICNFNSKMFNALMWSCRQATAFYFFGVLFFCTYFCGALYTCANATCRLCMRNSYASTPEVETTHAMYTAYSVVKFHEILLAWKFSLKNFHWKFYGFSVKCYDVSIILLTVFVVIWIFCHLWWKISMTISKNGFENNRKFHEILLSFITKNFTHISTRVAQKRRHRMFRQWWP